MLLIKGNYLSAMSIRCRITDMTLILTALTIITLAVAIIGLMLNSSAPYPYPETDTWKDHEQ
jgi:hypothetical protein